MFLRLSGTIARLYHQSVKKGQEYLELVRLLLQRGKR